MPNWCSNSFFVFDDEDSDKGSLMRFYLKLDELLKEETCIYDVLKKAGASEAMLEGINCRGEISGGNLEEKRDVLEPTDAEKLWGVSFWCESAWSPCDDAINLLINLLVPESNLRFVFVSEEPGCGIYINTDTEGRWFDDFVKVETEIDSYYFGNNDVDKAEFVKLINDLTGLEFKDWTEIQDPEPGVVCKIEDAYITKRMKETGDDEETTRDNCYININFFEC